MRVHDCVRPRQDRSSRVFVEWLEECQIVESRQIVSQAKRTGA